MGEGEKAARTKVCNSCQDVKPEADFYPLSQGRPGSMRVCITCVRIEQKLYYQANRVEILARQKRNKKLPKDIG